MASGVGNGLLARALRLVRSPRRTLTGEAAGEHAARGLVLARCPHACDVQHMHMRTLRSLMAFLCCAGRPVRAVRVAGRWRAGMGLCTSSAHAHSRPLAQKQDTCTCKGQCKRAHAPRLSGCSAASAARRRGHGPRPTPRHARRSRCASQRPASFVAARCSLSPSLVNSITVLQHRDGPGCVVGYHRPHRRPQPMQTTHQHHGYASDASRQLRRPWHTRATFLRKLSAVSMPQRRQPRVAERERDAAAGLPARFWSSAERLQAPPILVDEFAKNGAVNSARVRRC